MLVVTYLKKFTAFQVDLTAFLFALRARGGNLPPISPCPDKSDANADADAPDPRPLDNPWQQPDGCSVIVRRDPSYTGKLWQGQSCQVTGSATQSNYWIHQAHECFPPRTAAATTPTSSWYDNWGFYSPGLACPAGWSRACSTTYGEDGGGHGAPGPDDAAGRGDGSRVLPRIPVPSPYLDKEGAGTSVASFTVGMPMVQVVWRETDLPATMHSQPSSTTTTIATETNATAPESTYAAAPGISEGATVRLAVGASLGAVIVLMSIAFFVFVRRHRRRRATSTETRRQPPDSRTLQQQQYWTQQEGELPASSSPGELSLAQTGPYATAELPSHNGKGFPTNRARHPSQPSIKRNLIDPRKYSYF
ncbi:p63 related protein [Apiospora phragmitis]|uniref:P63 related protein n=1 Tax=Apiospora phragmitis TaxID=2905665 RepID=A0ABR1UTZ8_9PEZI